MTYIIKYAIIYISVELTKAHLKKDDLVEPREIFGNPTRTRTDTMSISTTYQPPASISEEKVYLGDRLEKLITAISQLEEPHWHLKGPLGSLRPTQEALADEQWDRDPDNSGKEYNYALLDFQVPYSVIVYRQDDKEVKEPDFGIALLDYANFLFITSDVAKIIEWACPQDASPEEQEDGINRIHAILDGAYRLARPSAYNF